MITLLKRIAKVSAALVVLAFLLSTSTAWPPLLTDTPPTSVTWEAPNWHHLGDPIEVTLRITTAAGVTVLAVPEVGDSLGEFEIRDRRMERHFRGDLQIIDAVYTVQYLKALDEGVFAPRTLPETRVKLIYRRWCPEVSLTYLRDFWRKAPEKGIYLLRLTKDGDRPYPLAEPVKMPFPFSILVRALGAIVLATIPLGWIRAWAVKRRAEKLQRQFEIAEALRPRRRLHVLWGEWQRTREYGLFLEACIIVRQLEKRELGLSPGGLLPRFELWLVTTSALYSGRELSVRQVGSAFDAFIKRFPDPDVDEV